MKIPLPTQPFHLFFEHRPDYLYAYVTCDDISLEIAKKYWTTILEMLHRRKYKRIMVEKNISSRLEAHDVFELVLQIARSGCCSIAFAIVDQNYDAQRAEFEESVGAKSGLPLQIFEKASDAEEWLLDINTQKLLYEQAATIAKAND